MQILITARHVQVTEDVRSYVRDKANKLPRYYDRIHEIEVILDHESEQFSAEMIVRADHKQTLIAHETGPDTFVLIDTITSRLERQLKKLKEKRRNHKHDGKITPLEEKEEEESS